MADIETVRAKIQHAISECRNLVPKAQLALDSRFAWYSLGQDEAVEATLRANLARAIGRIDKAQADLRAVEFSTPTAEYLEKVLGVVVAVRSELSTILEEGELSGLDYIVSETARDLGELLGKAVKTIIDTGANIGTGLIGGLFSGLGVTGTIVVAVVAYFLITGDSPVRVAKKLAKGAA